MVMSASGQGVGGRPVFGVSFRGIELPEYSCQLSVFNLWVSGR